jgi:hypothetical protein
MGGALLRQSEGSRVWGEQENEEKQKWEEEEEEEQ